MSYELSGIMKENLIHGPSIKLKQIILN